MDTLVEGLASNSYETKTKGTRTTPAARVAAEGGGPAHVVFPGCAPNRGFVCSHMHFACSTQSMNLSKLIPGGLITFKLVCEGRPLRQVAYFFQAGGYRTGGRGEGGGVVYASFMFSWWLELTRPHENAGVYSICNSNSGGNSGSGGNGGAGTTHLSYKLELPQEPGPVQAELGIAAAASLVLSIKVCMLLGSEGGREGGR